MMHRRKNIKLQAIFCHMVYLCVAC